MKDWLTGLGCPANSNWRGLMDGIIGAIIRFIIEFIYTAVFEVVFKAVFGGIARFGAGLWRFVTGRGQSDG